MSLQVKRPSGTWSDGYPQFFASFQVQKLERTHLVLLSVLAGVIPFASSLSSTKEENCGTVELAAEDSTRADKLIGCGMLVGVVSTLTEGVV